MHELIKNESIIFPKSTGLMSANCKDFIHKLLKKDPSERLGVDHVDDLLEHTWLQKLDTEKILDNTMVSPRKPDLNANDKLDVRNFDPQFTGGDIVHDFLPSEMAKVVDEH